MSASQFSIISAVRNAYVFVGREWRYLVKISLLPMGFNLLTEFVIFFMIKEPTMFEAVVWNIPATALTGWFMFAEARLILLGERTDDLPQDPALRAERQRDLSASILMFLLFYMGFMIFLAYQVFTQQMNPTGQNLTYTTIGMLLFGAGIWAARFGVAHILAAVGYPVRRYIYRVNGLGISFRLIGMALLAMLPILAATLFVVTLAMPDLTFKPTPASIILDAPMSFAIWAVLTAASCFALKEILGRAPEKNP
ncbi:MAG TPA: hypothetical protein VEF76_07480 [Patescibacteria group bacterium]|nr:hypothetical protein [Patescibacteria group bacterium]